MVNEFVNKFIKIDVIQPIDNENNKKFSIIFPRIVVAQTSDLQCVTWFLFFSTNYPSNFGRDAE